MTFEEIQNKVLEWAMNRNLLSLDYKFQQLAKVVEEVGELSGAIVRDDTRDIVDAFGDVLVTLVILAKDLEFDIVGCFEFAYHQIKDRKGETRNGIFIKEGE